ncbi:MAG: 30S ribosomal protein S19e [Candidatus Bathyarchaeia archaeon]
MPTVYDAPANAYVEKLAGRLAEEYDAISQPPWAAYVKTSSHADRLPENKDWWYLRCASLLRKLYLSGPRGVSDLSMEYGGRKSKGGRPKHTRRGSRNVVRKVLQQLQAAGLVKTVPKEGRVLTEKGRSMMDKVAAEVKVTMQDKIAQQV